MNADTETKDSRAELEATWLKYTSEGHKAHEERRYAFAELKFLGAIKAAEKMAEGLESAKVASSGDEQKRADLERLCIGLNNLAAIYHLQGKYQLAEESHERALDIRLDLFGEEHLDTAVTLFNLAMLHCAKRRWEKAEILFKRTIEIREKLLGKEDKMLVPVLSGYATMLQKVDRAEEGAKLEERAKGILNNA